MKRKKTTIIWHNAREESPRESGEYLTSSDETMVFTWEFGARPTTCLTLKYIKDFDKWNVGIKDGRLTMAESEITSVKWWASIEDIEEEFQEGAKNE